ncbi:MAG: TIGR04282 family arsenosugar biosynthesis glycosyltransferase [Woeseiaceae bacterium]|nr:TIGR04282 family arsenosugar biosynthesis glycosyltransferase [Woeseiaceae bacterium]
MKYHDTVLLLFAKAPVAGKVNTRLIPDIGVQAATKLQHDLIHQRLSMLKQANLCAVTLMCSPDVQDYYFVHCKQHYPISLLVQSGADLGERMLNGIKQALQQYKYCIVIGTDAPALDEELISQAIERLKTGDEVVFVPAEDGGYVLVGVQKPYEFLFQDISWGSAKVMQQTRDKLNDNSVAFNELATCWDIDRFEDYQRYLVLSKLYAWTF